MCILLVSTIHPDYPFILLFNRDEFLTRPTARASWWHPSSDPATSSVSSSTSASPPSNASPSPTPPQAQHSPSDILSGRDLVRPTHGTWLGITRSGRISALTNILEPNEDGAYGAIRSRGEAPILFLNNTKTTDEWVNATVYENGFEGIGGLTLFVTNAGSSAMVSNGDKQDRMNKVYTSELLSDGEKTVGLSNSQYEKPWPKVSIGTELLQTTIQSHQGARKQELLEKLFEVLSSTNPSWPSNTDDVRVSHLKNSVFIPAMIWHDRVLDGEAPPTSPPHEVVGVGDGCLNGNNANVSGHVEHERDKRYGTKEQTVILVDKLGHVTFVERTLHDGTRWLDKGETDTIFEWDLRERAIA